MKKLDEKELEHIADMGAFGYNAKKMALILGLTEIEVSQALKDVNSDIYKYYNIGKANFNFVIDKKLFKMAQDGDLKALEKLQERNKYTM